VNKGLVGRLTRPLDAWMVRRATAIWVTTRDYGSGSVSLRDAQAKVELLTLGIADPLDSDAGAPLPDRIATFAKGRAIVLSVGRLVPYKGFDQLLRAWARVAAPAVLVIAGHGAERERLQALIDELGLGDRVMLAGRLAQDELHALFRSATLYVMSSVGRTEAFGVVQIEAMAFSLPIVATDVPRSGVAWVSDRGALGGLVPINDPPALATAIDRVLASDRLPELRRASRARFERLFRVEQMVDTAAGTIARLAETGPGARSAEVKA
jgi:glycosyltransferase involved in cell wall biosynthesis